MIYVIGTSETRKPRCLASLAHRSGPQIAMGFPAPKWRDFAGEGLGSKYGDQL